VNNSSSFPSQSYYCQLPVACYLFKLVLTVGPRVAEQNQITALNILRRVGTGGHNNIEINPVFRGMVRLKDELLTKGKL